MPSRREHRSLEGQACWWRRISCIPWSPPSALDVTAGSCTACVSSLVACAMKPAEAKPRTPSEEPNTNWPFGEDKDSPSKQAVLRDPGRNYVLSQVKLIPAAAVSEPEDVSCGRLRCRTGGSEEQTARERRRKTTTTMKMEMRMRTRTRMMRTMKTTVTTKTKKGMTTWKKSSQSRTCRHVGWGLSADTWIRK